MIPKLYLLFMSVMYQCQICPYERGTFSPIFFPVGYTHRGKVDTLLLSNGFICKGGKRNGIFLITFYSFQILVSRLKYRDRVFKSAIWRTLMVNWSCYWLVHIFGSSPAHFFASPVFLVTACDRLFGSSQTQYSLFFGGIEGERELSQGGLSFFKSSPTVIWYLSLWYQIAQRKKKKRVCRSTVFFYGDTFWKKS